MRNVYSKNSFPFVWEACLIHWLTFHIHAVGQAGPVVPAWVAETQQRLEPSLLPPGEQDLPPCPTCRILSWTAPLLCLKGRALHPGLLYEWAYIASGRLTPCALTLSGDSSTLDSCLVDGMEGNSRQYLFNLFIWKLKGKGASSDGVLSVQNSRAWARVNTGAHSFLPVCTWVQGLEHLGPLYCFPKCRQQGAGSEIPAVKQCLNLPKPLSVNMWRIVHP